MSVSSNGHVRTVRLPDGVDLHDLAGTSAALRGRSRTWPKLASTT